MPRNNFENSLAERKQAKPKLYREAASEVNAALISADVAQKRRQLMASADRPKADLKNLEDVKSRTDDFLRACENTATVPTMLGLCVAFGCSREWLYRYLRNNSETPSAQFIELTREALADSMLAASLSKSTDPATTIFALKNLNGFVDRLEVAPKVEKNDPLGPEIDQKALEERINATVVIDDDDEY